MTAEVDLKKVFKLNQGFRLQWEKAQDAHVLLYPEGMVKLSPSAAEILTLCEGSNSGEDVVAALEKKFPEAQGIANDIKEFIQEALSNGWLK